jgi:hypothetical protein
MVKDIVCGLEDAKKLKGLGVKQKSIFYWIETGENLFLEEKNDNRLGSFDICDNKDIYSAFTLSELGDLLPRNIKIEFGICTVKECRVILTNPNINDFENYRKPIYTVEDYSEVGARVKMLIYLLEKEG